MEEKIKRYQVSKGKVTAGLIAKGNQIIGFPPVLRRYMNGGNLFETIVRLRRLGFKVAEVMGGCRQKQGL